MTRKEILQSIHNELLSTKGRETVIHYTRNKARWEMTFQMFGHKNPDKEFLYLCFESPKGRAYQFLMEHDNFMTSTFEKSGKKIAEYDAKERHHEDSFRKAISIVPIDLLERVSFFREVFEMR